MSKAKLGFPVAPWMVAELTAIADMQFRGPCEICGKPLEVLLSNWKDQTHTECFGILEARAIAAERPQPPGNFSFGTQTYGGPNSPPKEDPKPQSWRDREPLL